MMALCAQIALVSAWLRMVRVKFVWTVVRPPVVPNRFLRGRNLKYYKLSHFLLEFQKAATGLVVAF